MAASEYLATRPHRHNELQSKPRPSGIMLPTGSLNRAPSSPGLAKNNAWSEGMNFRRDVIATDDQFTSVAQAAETTGFSLGH